MGESCKFSHSPEELSYFSSKEYRSGKRTRTAAKKTIQVFLENAAGKDALLEVRQGDCIANSIMQNTRIQEKILLQMYATRNGRLVNLKNTYS